MGNVLLGLEEEAVKVLPVVALFSLVVYFIILKLFGGCRPFVHQLRSEAGELCGYDPLPPYVSQEARNVNLQREESGAVTVARAAAFVATAQETLASFLTSRPTAPSLQSLLRPGPTSGPPVPASAEPAAAGAPTCPVCITNWPNAALDCGHRVCAACLPQIQCRSNACPVCRDPIRQVIQLYN
mmetsp:Transcript_24360/g.44102  ORF Transcript_24360/g.44102 Transcript_24360/m.44102 type:complete len:184 (+) Transcript_24360:32-583(+)